MSNIYIRLKEKGNDKMSNKQENHYHSSDFKMTPEQLQAWIAKRKKCGAHKSKKDYRRKEKHPNAEYND